MHLTFSPNAQKVAPFRSLLPIASMSDLIQAGDTVIVRMHDDKSTNMLKVLGEQKICRSKVSTKCLVGAAYGSVYQITADRKLKLVTDEENDDVLEPSASDVMDESHCDSDLVAEVLLPGDNRGYIDTNTAQKLSNIDIKRLRESGASGKQIIASLIANSDTWSSKTEFAQEKWLKRKQKKYIRCMRIVKSCPATVCEVYHTKNKEKICGLRWDSLAQVLSASGVHSGSRVLIFDGVLGLAVGSVAYRLRGNGVVLASYAGQQPHFEIANCLNLDDQSLAVIQTIPSEELGPAAAHVQVKGFGVPVDATSTTSDAIIDATETNTADHSSAASSTPGDEDGSVLAEEGLTTGDTLLKSTIPSSGPRTYPPPKPHQGSGRQAEPLLRLREELRKGVDSLIIACKYEPLPILKTSLALLVPSSPFVVYCEFLEPLVACYLYVTEQQLAVKVSLSDTWSREFQTLPGRVHPQMFMSTSSGYILSGVYVGLPDCYKQVIPLTISPLVVAESQADTSAVDSNSEGDASGSVSLEMPRRQEHIKKKGRRR